MCGIVGYIGQNEAAPVLIKGLKKLEYRGYDSAGIAVFGDGIHVVKTKGRLADLDAKVQEMGGVKECRRKSFPFCLQGGTEQQREWEQNEGGGNES